MPIPRFWAIAAAVLIAAAPVLGQSPGPLCKWMLEFRDKSDTPYSVDRPAEFLSARCLERRARNGVPVLEEDLPVSPFYLAALRQQGYQIHGASRWLNAVAIIADTATALQAQQLPFVKNMTYLGRHIRIKNPPDRPEKRRSIFSIKREAEARFGVLGYGLINSAPIQAPFLYEVGARGAGIWVAVMDGGFTNVDTMPFFDSVAVQGRLWPGRDFVARDGAVYESAQHGTGVLSVMAAHLPGYFVGTAPEATYFLLKTEDTGGEFPIEEFNWVMGAEWADSTGVDIVNASLGYTVFNDTLLNHTYRELDGRTTLASRGGIVAARKGMIICNSAGNSGDEPWRYLGVPADVSGILAVGAVDSQTGARASFSSVGPTADGRIKPDLAAPGQNVVTAGNKGDELIISAGTSIASPILAGGIAALWSAFPERSAEDIQEAVMASADRFEAPDNQTGYGLPDLAAAWLSLKGIHLFGDKRLAGYDPVADRLTIALLPGETWVDGPVTIKNALGQLCFEGKAAVSGSSITILELTQLSHLPKGFYRLYAPSGKVYYWGK